MMTNKYCQYTVEYAHYIDEILIMIFYKFIDKTYWSRIRKKDTINEKRRHS